MGLNYLSFSYILQESSRITHTVIGLRRFLYNAVKDAGKFIIFCYRGKGNFVRRP